MKQFTAEKTVFCGFGGTDVLALADSGLHIRDVVIDAGIGEEISIGLVSDIHFNYCNDLDLEENDPVLMSTFRYRRWLADGETVPTARRCLEFLDDMDQLVVNGDTLDYLSHGTMELMQREIWDRYPNILATAGGHEIAIRMQGAVPETLSREERLAIAEKFWKHDFYYESRLIKNKVLAVGLFNDLGRFTRIQREKLAADIARARENGWCILLFAHEPLATGNPQDRNFRAEDAMLVGDKGVFPNNFCDGKLAGGEDSDEDTMNMYRLITGSADVIRAFFAGHIHSHIHQEIVARTPDGTDAVIPQYIHSATAYDAGHLMRITVR